MISFEKIPKVYIACGPTDLRKGIDGYAHIIQDTFKLSPFRMLCLFSVTEAGP